LTRYNILFLWSNYDIKFDDYSNGSLRLRQNAHRTVSFAGATLYLTFDTTVFEMRPYSASSTQKIGYVFIDGDDFHPPANLSKMASGVALTDDDRVSWLESIAKRLYNGKVAVTSLIYTWPVFYVYNLCSLEPWRIDGIMLFCTQEVL
jgi:hypothetical protein